MLRLRRRWVWFVAFGVAAVALPGACLNPTEILVRVTTNASCDASATNVTVAELGIAAGPPGTVTGNKLAGAPARSSACKTLTEHLGTGFGPSDLGTLALVPGGAKDEGLEVVVVALVNGPGTPTATLDDCLAWASDSSYAATRGFRNADTGDTSKPVIPCVKASRDLSFIPHESFELPIQLDASCAGVACNPGQTCQNHACVSTTTKCAPGSPCELSGSTGTGGMASSTSGQGGARGSSVATSTVDVATATSSISSSSTGCACPMCGSGDVCNPASCACTCTSQSCGAYCASVGTPGGFCSNGSTCKCNVGTTSNTSTAISTGTGTCCTGCLPFETCTPQPSCMCKCDPTLCSMQTFMCAAPGDAKTCLTPTTCGCGCDGPTCQSYCATHAGTAGICLGIGSNMCSCGAG